VLNQQHCSGGKGCENLQACRDDQQRFWTHANVVRAPEKDTDEQNAPQQPFSTTFYGNSCLLEDLINPDVEVEVGYWKSTHASYRHSKKASVSVCGVLHSLTVSGAEGPVQVFHGLCCKTNGQGYEAAVSSIVPFAYSLAKNISAHLAGWLYGYLKELGWSSETITNLIRLCSTRLHYVAVPQWVCYSLSLPPAIVLGNIVWQQWQVMWAYWLIYGGFGFEHELTNLMPIDAIDAQKINKSINNQIIKNT
jgi:hypothetical protein